MSKIQKINIDKITSELRKIARSASNEEELKINAERIIYENIISVFGLSVGKYEYTLISGARIDALYGHVVIEYKAPGVLSKNSGFIKARKQIIDYIIKEADVKERFKLFFGIILCDNIAFVKFDESKNDWIVRGPYDINNEVILKIVEAIRGLRRKKLCAEELLKDFGPKSEVALEAINILYDKLDNASNEKTNLLFKDWVRIFSQITGYKEEDLVGLNEFYDTSNKEYTKLLFCIHSYYALIMKIIAAELAYLYGGGKFLKSYVNELEDKYMVNVDEFKRSMEDLEDGKIFKNFLKIRNFIERSYFSWYLEEFDTDLMDIIAKIAKLLADYEPATPVLEPEETKDMLKIIYQNLVPKPIRHNLGEYYTPDWLAQFLLDKVNFTIENFEKISENAGDSTKPLELKLLDPACGSGTFLIEALKRLRTYSDNHFMRDMMSKYIINNIVGIDLNPLAVLAARTNFLLNIGDLLSYTNDIEIPIYLADSITIEKSATVFGANYKVRTAAGEFSIPTSIIDDKKNLAEILNIIEECVRLKYSADDFEKRLKTTAINIEDKEISEIKIGLYNDLLELEKNGKDHIWVSILRNAFRPLFIGKFDYVVGNPPWILWDNLPEDYRESTISLWKKYGLFTLSGSRARYGGAKKDISILFTYVGSDKYLKKNGKLGFLITQSVFKTKGAGEGFRSFRFPQKKKINGKDITVNIDLKLIEVHDFVDVKPFEGANNKTNAFILKKSGEKTLYPIDYTLWRKLNDIDQKESLETAIKKLTPIEMVAIPSDPNNELSPWITLPKNVINIVKNFYGGNEYQSHIGVNSGGANGVYFIEILNILDEKEIDIDMSNKKLETIISLTHPSTVKDLRIKNVTKGMKKEYPKVETLIEDFFVYPMIKSRNVKKWKIKGYSYIIQMQNPIKRIGFNESWVKTNFPKTYEYLYDFKKILLERALYKKYLKDKNVPFFSIYNVGEYTYAPFKVVWNRMGKKLHCCVISTIDDEFLGEKIILPENVIAFMDFYNEEEAHYVCAIMNSSITDMLLRSIAGGTKSFGTPNIIDDTIRILKFDQDNDEHIKLSELSKKAHGLALSDKDTSKIEAKIDSIVTKLYGMSEEDHSKVLKTITIQDGEIPDEEDELIEEVIDATPEISFINTVIEPERENEIEINIINPRASDVILILDVFGEEKEFNTSNIEENFKLKIGALKEGSYKIPYKVITSEEKIEDILILQVKSVPKHRKGRLSKKFDELL